MYFEVTRLKDVWQTKMQQLKRRRRVVWASVALAFLTAYFHRTVTGVVADSLMRDFAISQASELGILSSIYFYTYAILQIPAGIMADCYGPRLVISVAMLISACGAAMLGLTDSLFGLYAGRFLSSLGVSLIYVNIAKIQVDWFRLREFATMCGLLTLIGNAGSLLAATPLAIIVESLGWRASFYIIGVYSLIMAVICWLVVRDRPSDVGLPSITDIEVREGGATATLQPTNINIMDGIKTVMGNWYTWPPFLASVTLYGVYMAFIGIWGVPYFMQIYNMPRLAAANHVMAMVVGNMVGAPLVGYLSDRLGLRRGPFILVSILFLITWLVLTIWNGARPAEWGLYPICICMGIGVSGISIAVACAKEVNPPHLTGITVGVVNSGPFVGAALMQPIFGWVLDRNWQGAIEQGVNFSRSINNNILKILPFKDASLSQENVHVQYYYPLSLVLQLLLQLLFF